MNPSATGSGRRRTAAALGALSLLLCAAYSIALHGPFVFDDAWNLAPARIESLSLPALLDVARGNDSGPLGRPLAAVSFALNFALGDGGPFAFKATNLAIHVLNAMLVYLLCSRLLLLASSDRSRDGRREPPSPWPAVLVAALWAAHPLQASTVMYVVQRMTLLMGTFTFASLCMYAQARLCQRDGRGPALPWLLGSVPLAAAACLSKENGVLIAVYVLLIESLLLGRGDRDRTDLLWHRLVLLVSSVAVCAVVAALLMRIDGFADAYRGREFGPGERLLAQLHALVLYLRMLLLPDPSTMTFYYDDVVAPAVFAGKEALAATLLLALLAMAILLRRALPLLGLGVLFFFAGHLLESTVLPLELVFEHRNYVPSFGIALAVVAAASAVAGRGERWRRGIVATGVLALLVLLSQTHGRALVWSDAIVLNHHATIGRPASERAWISLAVALAERGDVEGGLSTLRRAAEVLPDRDLLLLQELQILWWSGVHDEDRFRRALERARSDPLRPKEALLLSHAVEAKSARNGDLPPSAAQLLALYEAASRRPRRLPAYLDATFSAQHYLLLRAAGRTEDALAAIAAATRRDPSNGEIALRHAEALVLSGRAGEARGSLSRAMRLAPLANERIAARIERVRAAIAEADVKS